MAVPLEAGVTVSVPRDVAEARRAFPGARQAIYMSICDRGLMADGTVRAVEQFLSDMQGASRTKADHERVLPTTRQRFATLIGATPEEVALVDNVSDGINTLAWSFPWKPGDRVVLCTALEHPNNLYPWLRLRRLGVELVDVPAVDGRIDPEAMIAAIDDRTRIVTCASVTFSPGFRTDLARIGAACRTRDVFFLVDAVQSSGILHHDVAAEVIDGLATSTSKGLLGLYGTGFLYCRRAWLDRLEPAYLSRTGAAVPTDTPSEMGAFEYALRPDAGRFEVGSHNFAGAYAANASLEMLLGIGPDRIEAHVLALSRALSDGLAALGLPVFTPPDDRECSHIITVGVLGQGGHGTTTDARLQDWSAHLKQNGVVHTIRRGQVRFALHLYNNAEDIDRTLELSDRFLNGRG